ncbi:MAG: HEAT repeat domain-containing protein [Bacteroidota bacterium]
MNLIPFPRLTLLPFLLGFLLIGLVPNRTVADTWTNPSWPQMLQESKLIALVEYTSSGTYRARAKIVKTYRGQATAKEIWIAGLSNRYGPIDEVQPGDRYLVFLRPSRLPYRNSERWKKQLAEDPSFADYHASLSNGQAYHVWTPSAGDLRVKRQRVQYSLLQTGFSDQHAFHPLRTFEQFLATIDQSNPFPFHRQMVGKLRKHLEEERATQHLLMLQLTGYHQYEVPYEGIAEVGTNEACLALARLLGQVEGALARDLLIRLLDHNNGLVQAEAVRQLSAEDADFIGPILLRQLTAANDPASYPEGLLRPGQERISPGLIQIIRSLGQLDYQAAIPTLLPLLDTEEAHLFSTVLYALHQLGTDAYVPYLNRKIKAGSSKQLSIIARFVTNNDIEACIPALMHFIAHHDKTEYPTQSTIISPQGGLAHFRSDSVEQFLYADFQSVLAMDGKAHRRSKGHWLGAYLNVFQQLDLTPDKALLYDALYDHYGLNQHFRNGAHHFRRKQQVEDSLVQLVSTIVHPIEPQAKITALVLIGRDLEVVDYTVHLQVPPPQDRSTKEPEVLRSLSEQIYQRSSINQSHLLRSSRSATFTDGARTIPRSFDQLMVNFLRYLADHPDLQDLAFAQGLLDFGYAQSDFEKRLVNRCVEQMREKLER